MDILAFASFAALIVVWLFAPKSTSAKIPAARTVEAPESVTAAA
jgi:hypothetical protein